MRSTTHALPGDWGPLSYILWVRRGEHVLEVTRWQKGDRTPGRGAQRQVRKRCLSPKRKDAPTPPPCHSAETRFPPGGRQPTPLPPWRVGRLREQVSSRQIFEPVCRLTLSPVDLSWGCRREAAKGSPGEGWPRAWGTEVAVTGMGGHRGAKQGSNQLPHRAGLGEKHRRWGASHRP